MLDTLARGCCLQRQDQDSGCYLDVPGGAGGNPDTAARALLRERRRRNDRPQMVNRDTPARL